MKAITLIRIEFDNMENSHAQSRRIVKTFVSDGHKSAHGVMADWFSTQKPERFYAGYDGSIYPQFETKIEY